MELNRRHTQRAIINRLNQYVRSDEFEQLTLIAVKERRNMLKKAYDALMVEHLRLVEADVEPEDIGAQDDYIAEVEEIYMRAIEIIQTRIEQMEREQRQPAANVRANNDGNAQQLAAAADIRLERIKLPTFDGDYSKWNEWKAIYESLVHDLNVLSNTEKFHRLKRSLSGSAERVLGGWQITAENYQPAYNLLIEAFDNPYRIIMAHLDELTNLERNKTETGESLRTLIDTTNRVLRQLRVLGCPVEHWDHFIVHGLISRMSPRTLQAWETSNHQDIRAMPAMDDVLKFLERRARAINNMDQTSTSNDNRNQSKQENGNKSKGFKPSANRNDSNSNGAIKCHNCGLPHPMYRCQKFKSLNLNQRRDRTRELQVCFNCFKPTHSANSQSCQFGECKNCPGKRHNSLLCPKAVVVSSVQIQELPQAAPSNSQQRAITNAPMFVPSSQNAQASSNEVFQ